MIDEKKLKKELAELSLKCPYSVLDERFALYTECFEKAICLLKEQPKVGEWIPCNERLPEEREFVIVLAKNHGMDIGCLTDNEWYCSGYELSLNKIIAWMPLPESYKGAETE